MIQQELYKDGYKAQLFCGDCRDVMRCHLAAESVDLTVTSPPYDTLRVYDEGVRWDWGMFCEVVRGLWRVTKLGGVVWVVGDETVDGSEGDVVFAPFMGSGTTGKMALIANRNFVGCELVEKFYRVACRRVQLGCGVLSDVAKASKARRSLGKGLLFGGRADG